LQTFAKRLKALESKLVQGGLSESQIQALEKPGGRKKSTARLKPRTRAIAERRIPPTWEPSRASAEFTSRRSLIRTIAFARLYDRKNALVTADMLNDRVLRFLKTRMFRCCGY
jgi:hypothetical protein